MHGSSSSSRGGGSMTTTVSKDDSLFLSSEDSSCPDRHSDHLQLSLGLSLSPSPLPTARILTAKHFPSVVSSPSPSPSSLSRSNVTSGTKRAADSVVATNAASQVVGWPPLGVYRMNSLNSHARLQATGVFNSVVEKSKSNRAAVRNSAHSGSDNNHIISKEKGNLRSSLFVKVNMDGVPIGRKVDLSAYSSYEILAQALEDMFNEPTTVVTSKGSKGKGHGIVFGADGETKLLDGSSNFVLTYEDKEGDWMLVGDVPWWMFLGSVKRLRIMRTPEANGLAPILEEKNSRLKSKPA